MFTMVIVNIAETTTIPRVKRPVVRGSVVLYFADDVGIVTTYWYDRSQKCYYKTTWDESMKIDPSTLI
jgi:hypothetical protein